MEQEIGVWDSVLLEHLTEDNFISNLHQRYKRDHIYTYIGTSVVAINPFKTLSLYSQDHVKAYGSKGIFQLPPHIYGLANLAYQSLKDQSEDQCIIMSGESGSGKTESSRKVISFLTQIQDAKKIKSSRCHFARRRNSSTGSTTIICSRPNSRPSTPKRQSPVPNSVPIEKHGCLIKARSESSDRSSTQRKLSREKMVDFDFSHHKSSENLPQQNPIVHSSGTTTTTKSCFKHNHVDAIGRSKTLSNVDYCIRKSNCDLTKNSSTNRLNETTSAIAVGATSQSSSINTKLNACCNTSNTTNSSNLTCNIHNQKSSNAGSTNFDHSTLPNQSKITNATQACKQCSHLKCGKQQSLDTNDETRTSSTLKSSKGSCTNLNRRGLTVGGCCNPSLSNLDNAKISSKTSLLLDAQRLNQSLEYSFPQPHVMRERTMSSSSDYTEIGKTQKVRDRVACSYVFLEAMGNAMTTKNNNSSRFGKFFDMEIDFKGDPIGIHITHYTCNKYKCRGT